MTKPMTAAQRAAKQASRRKNRARWPSSPRNANGPEWGKVDAAPPEVVVAAEPKSGLADLLAIMRDTDLAMRDRLSAGISASRVSSLAMGGEPEPEAVRFLRWITDAGERFSAQWRREAAQALAYWERRVAKMAVTFDVADEAERREKWRRICNAGIRHHLWLHNRWPRDKHILLTASDAFEVPDIDPDAVLSALFVGAQNRHQRRRLKAIDERVTGTWSGSEAERVELLRVLAVAMHQRLEQFKLTG
jgi:hypothetical protein